MQSRHLSFHVNSHEDHQTYPLAILIHAIFCYQITIHLVTRVKNELERKEVTCDMHGEGSRNNEMLDILWLHMIMSHYIVF